MPTPPFVDLPKAFEDARGVIQPLVDLPEDHEPARSLLLIMTKAGSVRAAHRHATDWHYTYVLEGKLVYIGGDAPARVVGPGQMVLTPPGEPHVMRFPVDTTMIVLARNSRTTERYEADTTRMPELIKES